MRKWMSRRARPIGWTLVVAFSVVLSASCTTDASMTEAEMACCEAMGHDCGPMANPEDCCSHDSGRVAQFLATAKTIPLAVPVAVLMPFTLVPDTASAALRSDFAHTTDVSLKPSRVPKYLLDSTFLI